MEKTFEVIVIVLAVLCIFCPFILVLTTQKNSLTEEKVCNKGHYEESPHHIMCINNKDKNIFCSNPSEWETYFVCDY